VAALIYAIPFPGELLDRGRVTPVRVLDRRGRLIWEGLAPDGTRGRWVKLEEISPWLIEAVQVAEDRRFRAHPGVDPLAALRAARDNARLGRRVSGASTISMQVVRLMKPRPRTWWAKLSESVLALRLEWRLTKEEILEEYLNRAPFGGNAIGAEAGARRHFGKSARDLSPAEAAYLAAMPQSPARFTRRPELAGARRRWILDEMLRLGKLDAQAHGRAVTELDSKVLGRPPVDVRSYLDWVLRPGDRERRTGLDLELQEEVDRIVRGARPHLEAIGADEAAAVVVENASGNVLAFVGPAARRRSPGSALKPFVYALELERGRAPGALYDDRPVSISGYRPRNYDGEFYGPVTMRQALANSLNVPAVLALRNVGLGRFVELAREAGMTGVGPTGLGAIVGDARVSPVELAVAYSKLASGRLLSPGTCRTIADMLCDDGARALAFGTGFFDEGVAVKTGTSADHRDNWVAGYTPELTAVVWVGNGDGRPMRGSSGVTGAGPIFRAIVRRLGGSRFEPLAREESEPPRSEFRIEFPAHGDRFALGGGGSTRFLNFRASEEAEWFLDGTYLGRGLEIRWTASPGEHELRARRGAQDRVCRFELRP
jgi:penicillin-binding protein 1C